LLGLLTGVSATTGFAEPNREIGKQRAAVGGLVIKPGRYDVGRKARTKDRQVFGAGGSAVVEVRLAAGRCPPVVPVLPVSATMNCAG
jgi:hypothetical protein